MRRRGAWCWLWGHSPLFLHHYAVQRSSVFCGRCGRCVAEARYGEELPVDRRGIVECSRVTPDHWRINGGCTIGPLRRMWEYLDCQLFGHNCEWVRQFNRRADVETCWTCGRQFRERPA